MIFGDAYARVDLAPEAKALGIGSTTPNTAWPDAVPFNEQLSAYNVQMPSDEFQARMGCYFVSSEFVENYPDRYDALVKGFEAAAANADYIQMLKDAKVYDSCVLKAGTEYSDQLTAMADEVQNVVAPMFAS